MKKILFGLLLSMSLLSACYASDISVEPLLNNVYDAVNQSLWVSGASVNGTDISVENLTANGTINVTGTDVSGLFFGNGVEINTTENNTIEITVANFTIKGGSFSGFSMFNSSGVLVNCTVNDTNNFNCVP